MTVDEFPQAQVQGQGGWKEQADGRRTEVRHWPPGGGHQRRCGSGRDCSVTASIGCSLFPGGFLFREETAIGAVSPPLKPTLEQESQRLGQEEHLFALSGGLSHALVRWIGAKIQPRCSLSDVILNGILAPLGAIRLSQSSLIPVDFQDSCYWVLLVLGSVFCSKTIIPDSEEHLFALSGGLSHALGRWRSQLRSLAEPSDPVMRIATVSLSSTSQLP